MKDYNEKMEEFKYEVISETKSSKIKQLYWNIAFGLQEVDNLKPSSYMIDLAKENVKGNIKYDEVSSKIHEYYQSNNENSDEKEADIVSLRIVQLLHDPTFRFDYNTYRLYHKYLFDEIDIGISHKYIGMFRDYNITKKEPILNNDTVMYADFRMIKGTLEYDFNEEKNQDYSAMSEDEIVNQIATFTSHIWQVHPFGEGNTRTTALFIQKYIMYLGLGKMNNEIFKEYSKYFRNSLVRANYSNINKGIKENDIYLKNFFQNLLYNKNIPLDDKELYIK